MDSTVSNYNQMYSSQQQDSNQFAQTIAALQGKTTTAEQKLKVLQDTNDNLQQIYLTRTQMLNSLIQMNEYKQKIIYVLIVAIILIFIIFSLLLLKRRSGGNRGNRS
jgi:hypothetical protein